MNNYTKITCYKILNKPFMAVFVYEHLFQGIP